jgi:formamidopyrimidine-DNA glycosylase
VPELPEVETVRRQLEPQLAGRRVIEAWSHPSDKFTPARLVVGSTFGSMTRRGKFLILPAVTAAGQEEELVVHLGMTGRLTRQDQIDDFENPHLRAWWTLDDHTALSYIDVRRFGRIRVVPKGDYRSIPTLDKAGPEPFDPALDDEMFHRLLQGSRRPIKTRLLSQRPVAGVGNIYADEALWLARINPKARRIGRERAGRLLTALRAVLEQGLANGGTTLRDYRDATGGAGTNQHRLRAYGRGSEPCSRCSDSLRSQQIDGRTTTWCPTCQRK